MLRMPFVTASQTPQIRRVGGYDGGNGGPYERKGDDSINSRGKVLNPRISKRALKIGVLMSLFFKIKTVILAVGLVIVFCPKLYGTDLSLSMGVIKPSVRVEAPAFNLPSLKGGPLALSDFNGKVILLNFWATWCAPCKEEMPAMERLWKRLRGKNFVIISVAVDRGSSKAVRRFSKEHGITFPVLLDPDGHRQGGDLRGYGAAL